MGTSSLGGGVVVSHLWKMREKHLALGVGVVLSEGGSFLPPWFQGVAEVGHRSPWRELRPEHH